MQLEYELPPEMTIDALRKALASTLKASKKITAGYDPRDKQFLTSIGIDLGDSSTVNIIPFLIKKSNKDCTEFALIYQALEHIRTDKSTDDDILTREARIVLLCHKLLFDEIDGKVELCDKIREIFFPDVNDWNNLTSAQREKFKKLLFNKILFYCNGGKISTITSEVGYYQQFLESMLFGYSDKKTHIPKTGMKRFAYIENAKAPETPLASFKYLSKVLTKAQAPIPEDENFIISSFRSHFTVGATLGVSGTAILGTTAIAAVAISILSGGTIPIIASGIVTILTIAYGASAFGIANKASLPQPIIDVKQRIKTINDLVVSADGVDRVIIQNRKGEVPQPVAQTAVNNAYKAMYDADPEIANTYSRQITTEEIYTLDYVPPLCRLADLVRSNIEKEADATDYQNRPRQ
jgi:hypothetical protein